MKLMLMLSKEVSATIDDLANKFENFTNQIKKNRLPSYLEKDNLFLGKYMIKEVMPYNLIYDKNLLS